MASAGAPVTLATARRVPSWWPLAALILLAAVVRLSTLDLQSFWYDEAFTPVHVLHPSLSATLHSVVHSENSPPLWYLLAWLDFRILGDGVLALRLPSALAGIATVPVVWAIAQELAGRRAALIAAALVAVNPLFVWYSQEARVYALFVLLSALAMLCFVRAVREPTRGRMAAFALAGALALLTHYFAVFLLIGMALWLLRERVSRRAALPALAVLALVGLALLPLISAQGGHGTQWIGRWALASRLQAIPQYYLTGYSGAPLGHGVELLVALPIVAGVLLGLWRLFEADHARTSPAHAAGDPATRIDDPDVRVEARVVAGQTQRAREGAALALLISACGVLGPIVLVAFGADYLAPRNLVAAMIPLTVLIAILLAAIDTRAPRRDVGSSDLLPLGTALAGVIALAFLLISLDVDLSPRLQRGNWRDVAGALGRGSGARAITTVELGAAPLEYYLPPLANLAQGASVTVSEIDETGYAPLRASAGRPPAPGFHLLDRRDVDGLIVFRFISSVPRVVSQATLRRHVITLAHPEVLVPPATGVSVSAGPPSRGAQMSSSGQNI